MNHYNDLNHAINCKKYMIRKCQRIIHQYECRILDLENDLRHLRKAKELGVAESEPSKSSSP